MARLTINPKLFNLEDDIYTAIVKKTSRRRSQKGNLVLTVTYKITEGDFQNVHVSDSLTITEESLWKLNATYKALTGEDLPEGEMDEEELADILEEALKEAGPVSIVVKHELFEGERRARVTVKGEA